ncbi:hypothetical protein POX_b03046 [Penicillium oxalicum]|uniref:hypothetical protein n=1 Tax=Penicillium oxalicum TaxID=69781 RepID=UPI0020B739AA|nr:hypothetical protein POX_b03046 [Penicillium oxalicum]KAI2793000.1 hypothetical protein POX_b03046 [Penicillium oxalicum]
MSGKLRKERQVSQQVVHLDFLKNAVFSRPSSQLPLLPEKGMKPAMMQRSLGP